MYTEVEKQLSENRKFSLYTHKKLTIECKRNITIENVKKILHFIQHFK